jgi:hypothetical protein
MQQGIEGDQKFVGVSSYFLARHRRGILRTYNSNSPTER